MTDDFFRCRLDQMIDLRHPLAVLVNRIPLQEIEASLAQRLARQVRCGKKIEGLDLYGSVAGVVGGTVSNALRPRFIATKDLSLLLRLLRAAGLAALFGKLSEIIGCSRLQSSDQCRARA